MAYRPEEEKGLSNSFLLGPANQGYGDKQSKQQLLLQRPSTEGDTSMPVWIWQTRSGPSPIPRRKIYLLPFLTKTLKQLNQTNKKN